MILRMKFFFVLAAFGTLVSCNTSIGVWRDTKATYNWSKKKTPPSTAAAVAVSGERLLVKARPERFSDLDLALHLFRKSLVLKVTGGFALDRNTHDSVQRDFTRRSLDPAPVYRNGCTYELLK